MLSLSLSHSVSLSVYPLISLQSPLCTFLLCLCFNDLFFARMSDLFSHSIWSISLKEGFMLIVPILDRHSGNTRLCYFTTKFGCFVCNRAPLFFGLSDEYRLNKQLILNRKGAVLDCDQMKVTCTPVTSKFIWKSWFPLQWSYNIIPLWCVLLHNSAEPISPLHPHLQLHEL